MISLLTFILQGPEDLKDFGAGLYVRRTSSMSRNGTKGAGLNSNVIISPPAEQALTEH